MKKFVNAAFLVWLVDLSVYDLLKIEFHCLNAVLSPLQTTILIKFYAPEVLILQDALFTATLILVLRRCGVLVLKTLKSFEQKFLCRHVAKHDRVRERGASLED